MIILYTKEKMTDWNTELNINNNFSTKPVILYGKSDHLQLCEAKAKHVRYHTQKWVPRIPPARYFHVLQQLDGLG